MSGSRLWMAAALLGASAVTLSEPTNFRVGVGSFQLDSDPAPAYLPDNSDTGFSLFAEMPQSNHTATRFMLYRIDQDDKFSSGFQTQLMWGIGLSQPGFRAYTGPSWHHEKNRITRAGKNHQVFNGWGWQLGLGYQYKSVTLDLAATVRDPSDYRTEYRRAGLGKKTPSVYTTNLLIGYRF